MPSRSRASFFSYQGAATALSIVLLASGCGSPSPGATLVSVDLSKIEEPTWDLIPTPPRPPSPLPGQQATLPGLPARTVRTTGDRTLQEIEAQIQNDVQQAIRSLTNRLSRIYQAEIRGREAELMAPLQEMIEREIGAAYAEITAAFMEYAEQRGRILPELSLLIDSTNYYRPLVPPTVQSVPVQRKYERAVELQKRLKDLDLDFKNLSELLLAQAQITIRDREAELRLEFAKLLLEANDRAEADARSEVSRRRQDLQLSPGGQARLDLPAVPEETVTAPGGRAIPPAPEIPDGLPSSAERREALESDLRIWLAVNGYKLDKRGEDRTSEFQAWRNQRTPGN